MVELRLITAEDIPNLFYTKLDWDVEVKGVPYQVIRVPGFPHCTGGHLDYGDGNIFWAYPLNEELSIDNIRQYNGLHGGVRWGLEYFPIHYNRNKWDEQSIEYGRELIITRNGSPFYNGPMTFHQAIAYVQDDILRLHPLNLNERNYDQKCIGRKIWWRSEPAVIKHCAHNQAGIMIVPDGIEKFTTPAEYANDPLYSHRHDEDTDEVYTDIFDPHINWFRD